LRFFFFLFSEGFSFCAGSSFVFSFLLAVSFFDYTAFRLTGET
jgi:hypothetical protein